MLEQRVYFITGGGKTKIGLSANPRARLMDLQVGSPVPLVLVHSFSGTWEEERFLHLRHGGKRMHGEWFLGEITKERAVEEELLVENWKVEVAAPAAASAAASGVAAQPQHLSPV